MSINYTQALKRYLNQSASWERCTGYDEYGKAIYADAKEIKVRRIPMQKLIADSVGRQVVSKMTVLCYEDIAAGDLIDGEVVLKVEWSVDRWGRNVARQAFLGNR